jgi:hypothetical protein
MASERRSNPEAAMSANRNRREFLKAAAAGAAGLAVAGRAPAAARPPQAKSCIFINLIGGPSQLDTFDPKPDASSDIRGPFRAIQTQTPGVYLSELFPKLAAISDKFSLIRSMHHDAPPIHESGLQLLNTGHLFRDGPEWPNVGAVLACWNDCCYESSWSLYPDRRVETGVAIGRGQSTGFLDPIRYRPIEGRADIDPTWSPGFETWCELARRKVERDQSIGVASGFVTINQFSTVFDSPSWDCHADRGSLRTDLADIRDIVAPGFDTALTTLLTDLEERGLLESTLVVATGEFGRTPKLNANGGRDHWAGCWTALVAGGGIRGGKVLGASDAIGSEPNDRPVTPQQLVATVYHALGVDADATIPGPQGRPEPIYPAQPLTELFN